MKKRVRSKHKKSLLKRIERAARHAAAERLHGNIERANQADRNLDRLMSAAEHEHVAGAGFEREMRGRQRGERLYRKIVG